jgi:eukaryotic-like serine/threonine-protein kinase
MTAEPACPEHNVIAAFVDGALDGDELAAMEAHVDTCELCRRQVSFLVAASGATPASAPDTEDADDDRLAPGARIGRFVVVRRLARGGMAVVAVGYDPELDRRVALKLLHPELTRSGRPLRDLLQREAKIMARLSHPNIVSVYDVGAIGDQVFVAMELVRGATLADWARAAPRRFRARLHACLDAGRGLAAAHRAGVVHRDFKPANVLVGDDGRVQVSDFGMASLIGEVGDGRLAGTLAYMAPEQHAGQASTERSDQWSFCAASYEVLCGVRPFAGRSSTELAAAIAAGRIAAPVLRDVPARVRRVLERGLARDPAARFPAMDELLAALAAAGSGRRRRRLALGAALAAALAAMALWPARAAEEPCGGADERAASAWDAGRRGALIAAMTRSGSADDASRVARVLDDYAGTWRATYTDVCRATRVRGEQSEALLDRRIACLDRGLGALAALVSAMSTPGAVTADKAIDAVYDLPGPGLCASLPQTGSSPPPREGEPGRRAQVVRAAMDKARADSWLGRTGPALALARNAERDARALGHPGLLAELLLFLAILERTAHDLPAAEKSAREAAELAWQADDSITVARAFTTLVSVVGDKPERTAEANVWAVAAERELARTGDAQTRAELDLHLGANAIEAADYAAARVHLERALATEQSTFGPNHPRLARSIRLLGTVRLQLGDHAGAEALYRRDLDLLALAYGPEHPEVAVAMGNVGMVLFNQGKAAEARAILERALALREKSATPNDLTVGLLLSNLGNACFEAGDYKAARAYHERSLARHEAVDGPDHPRVGRVLVNLANALDLLGEVEPARKHYERAIRIQESKVGADHPDVAVAVFNLGDLLARAGRCREALPLEERALRLWGKLGADHPSQGYALTGLAACDLALGHASRAVTRLERAEKVRSAKGVDARLLGETRFYLARARWSVGEKRGALAAARAALGSGDPDLEREVKQWLTARGAPPR